MNVDGINVLVLVTAVGRTATVEVAPDRAPITFGIATLIANILVFFIKEAHFHSQPVFFYYHFIAAKLPWFYTSA